MSHFAVANPKIQQTVETTQIAEQFPVASDVRKSQQHD